MRPARAGVRNSITDVPGVGACAETTPEGVYDALAGAEPALGRNGKPRPALRDAL